MNIQNIKKKLRDIFSKTYRFLATNKNLNNAKIDQGQSKQALKKKKNFAKVMSQLEGNKFCIKTIAEESVASIRLPEIHNVTHESSESIKMRFIGIKVYKFTGVYQAKDSDIIYFHNNALAFWHKSYMRFHGKEMHSDSMLNSYDELSNVLDIKKYNDLEIVSVENGISLLGVGSENIAHFIIEFIPKLFIYLNLNLNSPNNYKLLISDELDDQQEEILNHLIAPHKNITLQTINRNQVASCKHLIYCSAVSYICNNASYTHITDIIIPPYTRKLIHKFYQKTFVVKRTAPRKLYLSRELRSLKNNKEVEDIFIRKGYEIIKNSHLLPLKDKINMFGNASHIAGPGGSAFIFSFFSRNKCQINLFYNFPRAFDTSSLQIMDSLPTSQFTYRVFIGIHESKSDINCDYSMKIEDINKI